MYEKRFIHRNYVAQWTILNRRKVRAVVATIVRCFMVNRAVTWIFFLVCRMKGGFKRMKNLMNGFYLNVTNDI
jgi:hypothetical protein